MLQSTVHNHVSKIDVHIYDDYLPIHKGNLHQQYQNIANPDNKYPILTKDYSHIKMVFLPSYVTTPWT